MNLQSNSSRPSLRSHVNRILSNAGDGDRSSRLVDIFLITLIVTNVLAVVFESIDSIEIRYHTVFHWFEVFTICVFSVEYLLRVWSCVEANTSAAGSATVVRLRYIFSFLPLIDLLVILPFYLLIFGALGNIDIRVLRVVRLLRVLRLARYTPALNMLLMTFKENGRALSATCMIMITVMLLAASGMYFFERHSQPVDFGSIPAAMWWAFSTLTTVGYGDVTPVTVGGKVFGALITVVGVGMVALPTGILASGYNQQLQQRAKQFQEKADEALEDGVLTANEVSELEALRLDLGIGKHTASQILESEKVRAALVSENDQARCPHCNAVL